MKPNQSGKGVNKGVCFNSLFIPQGKVTQLGPQSQLRLQFLASS